MTTTLTHSRHRREAKNTYKLPQGEALRKELVKWFRRQRVAVRKWIKTGKIEKKDVTGGTPQALPNWNAFGLGKLPMAEQMAVRLESIWDSAGQKFTSAIGLDPDSWSVTNPKIQKAIQEAALAFCDATNATTSLAIDDAIAAVRDELQQGLFETGDSVAQLTTRIEGVFDGAETWRARRIAASEASRAMHSAQIMAAKESGVVTGFEWLASEDACEMCQTIARRAPAVALGQPFAIIGDNPDYSDIESPPAHPGCQCSLVEVLDTDPQPEWSETLNQPEPEEQDYAPGEAPEPESESAPEPKPVSKPPKASPVKPREPQPAGIPVSDALDVQISTPRVERAAQETLALIDQVHGDGNLPDIPIVEVNKGTNQGFMKLSGTPLKPVELAIHKWGDTPQLTVAHEIGHVLDWSGIDAKYRTAIGGIDFRKNPRFNGFLEAIDKSEAIKNLDGLKTQQSVQYTQGILTSTVTIDQKYVDYLLSDTEVWARAYSQYIATKSEDPAMMAELDHMIRFGQRVYVDQWDHKDFEPITKEIDKLFKGLGWIK